MFLFELIPALLFVLSSGLLFQDRFRENRFMVAFASVVALVASYFLFEQITDRMWPKVEAKQASTSTKVADEPAAPKYKGFADLAAVRDAVNGLTENTTEERLTALFGVPAERSTLKGERYRGHDITVERYDAGPFAIHVVRTQAAFIGYGIARTASAEAKDETPLLFLDNGNGWKNLEQLTIGTVKDACDPSRDGKEAAALMPVPEGGTAQLAASPECDFGRPGGYAAYSFVYAMGGAGLQDEACKADYASIEKPGAFAKLTCPAYLDRTPDFVFMTKNEDVDVQRLAARVYGSTF